MRKLVSKFRRKSTSKGRGRRPRPLAFKKLWREVLPTWWFIPAVAVAFLAAVLLGKPKARYSVSVTSVKLEELYAKATKGKDVSDRITFWSERLKREPNLLSSLGRGPKVSDTAPVFPASYDCTTYVETVAALARTTGTKDLANEVVAIRYKGGKVSYENRNHFPEADWIPNNESAGILKDVTVSVAYKADLKFAFAKKVVQRVAWMKRQAARGRAVASIDVTKRATQEVELPYIPVADAVKAMKHIPNGAVVNVVRESRDKSPVLISHQGFLIWKGNTAFLRHANRQGEIKDVPFLDYLQSCCNQEWKVIGFNVNAFNG